MADEQFEKDARRMSRGMLTSPLKYNKMYEEKTPAAAPAATPPGYNGEERGTPFHPMTPKKTSMGTDAGEIGTPWAKTFTS